ncbi:hypothetical protein [Crocosphaera chwakensis]|uniref:Uncharacterized protein n=1 Tax=Crocosphaera chwakensis CCY0110 TaxID=391612 RepID=A3ITW0_9CHRO|nr:hypothetical protein [Crocosphaera chwakensis]EAZ90055.1 hypothetical protein CY0110_14955 [Crocosphaera chwakensis CCY0110]
MAQQLIQIVEHQGIPYAEYREEPDRSDLIEIQQKKKEIVIKVQPSFPDDFYEYPEPKYAVGQKVVIADDWYYCSENGIDFHDEYEIYTISTIRLVEPTSRTSKGLTSPPYFLFGIYGFKNKTGYELTWFPESEFLTLDELESKEF